MDFPGFNEFLNSFDSEEFGHRFNESNMLHMLQFNPLDIQAAGTALTMIYEKAVQDSFKAQLALLEQYHEWLRTQLES